MFRFAYGQLVLVALTACVSGQSSGFLKSQVSSESRNTFPVVSVLQQIRILPKQTQAEKEAAGANAREDAVLKLTWNKMLQRHQVEQQKRRAAMNKYDIIMTRRYSCTSPTVRANLKKNIASQRRVSKRSLNIKQQQEKQLFMRRMKCMQQVPGDQSMVRKRWGHTGRAKVTACMKAGALLEKSPVGQYQGLTLNEKAAVKKQTDRFQQMQLHAMNDALESLFNTEQKYEQNQIMDTWEKDNKKALQQCEQSTGTKKKVVDVKEKEAKAVDDVKEKVVDVKEKVVDVKEKKVVDVKQKLVKADTQKADMEKHAAIVSEFTDALADAKRVMAEANEYQENIDQSD